MNSATSADGGKQGRTHRPLWLRRICRAAFIGLLWLNCNVAQAQTTNYVLGTSALLTGPGAGVGSLVLGVTPRSAGWTATATPTWLHLTPSNQRGTGSTNLFFSYDANPGLTRSGTLSIGDQTLTVTQAGSTYVPAGTVTVLFGEGELLQQPQGVSVDREGNVYATDINYNNVTEWPPAHYNDWTILAFHGLFQPGGVAVDGVGNVYVADSGNNAIKEWIAASNNVVTLVSSGLYLPQGVALDGASNVYIADSYNSEIKEWTAANGNVTTLVSSGLSYPYGLAVDAAGNVYIADSGNNAIKEWIAANSNVITLVSTGLNSPLGVAVDGAGNVYIADSENFAVKKWTAANNSVTTLVSNDVGFLPYVPQGVAVDEAGDVFFANTYSSETIDELPYALVDLAPKVESAAGGNDSLPVVLPTTADLFPPLFPTASDRPWLVITGVTNGVVSFSVAANPGLPRIGKITMLGKSVPVVQVSGGSPKNLIALPTDGDRACAFAFGDTNNASFTVLSSTNLSAPPSGWTVVGVASNTAPQLYEFTDAQPTNDQRYYRIRSP